MNVDPVDVCYAIAKEQGVPRVDAVTTTVAAVLLVTWDDMIEEVASAVALANRDEQGPERALFLAAVLWQALWRAPRRGQVEFLRSAAVRLGAGERTATAVEDALLMLRGKFQTEWPAVNALINRPGASHVVLRDGLVKIFGEPHVFTRAIADLWSYRWHWVGGVLDARRRGVRVFRYTNPLTPTTTAFCRWLVTSGRVLTLDKAIAQVNGLERAASENDVLHLMDVWPMLQFTGQETDADFAAMYEARGLGVPPFHFGCRTGIEPQAEAD